MLVLVAFHYTMTTTKPMTTVLYDHYASKHYTTTTTSVLSTFCGSHSVDHTGTLLFFPKQSAAMQSSKGVYTLTFDLTVT